MLVLALDTTTRRGSAALWRDGAVLDCEVGDESLPHGQRLPGDLIRLLDRCHVRLSEVDLFAVAAGPGSFTGLRIGIAAMQGLALANGRDMAGVSALDALNAATQQERGVRPLSKGSDPFLVGVLMDAQRGEVYSALYRGDKLLEGAAVENPLETVSRWKTQESLTLVGDGALVHAELVRREIPGATLLPEVPMLAPAIAGLAEAQALRHEAVRPDAIRPIYVRRPDVELARDRTKHQAPGTKH